MIKMRLVRLLSHAKKYIVYQIIWQWISLIAQVVTVFFTADLIEDSLCGAVSSDEVIKTAVVFVVCIAVRCLCERAVSYCGYRAGADVKRILREKIYEKLLRLGSSYKEKTASSDLVQMSTEGADQLEVYFGKYLSQLFYSLIAPLTLFIILSIKINVRAPLVLLICVPLIPVSIVVVQKIAKRLLNKYWDIYANLGDTFLEDLQGLTTLKIYRADGKKAEEMDRESEHFRKITMKVLTMQLNSTSVMDIMAYGGAAAGIAVAVKQFMAGVTDLSEVLVIILLAVEFFLPLRVLGSYFHIAMNGMAASDRIFAFLDLPEPEQNTQQDHFRDITGHTGDIIFSNVNFSYVPDRQILKDINIEIPEKSFVSIVGESGSGKSTIAGLLTGKNKDYSGSVRLGGIELSEIKEKSLLKHVTLVNYDSYIFKGTVEDNLRMAAPDADGRELIRALERCNLWGELKTRGGLKAEITERGGNLSGGQKQRLALARALLHDSDVYIFDEATSNIDAESEEMIMDVIRGLAGEKTVILISHRLSNVTGSDRIYTLAGGSISEYGTHKELIENKKEYYKLFESQKRLEEYAGK